MTIEITDAHLKRFGAFMTRKMEASNNHAGTRYQLSAEAALFGMEKTLGILGIPVWRIESGPGCFYIGVVIAGKKFPVSGAETDAGFPGNEE